ncbi:conserved hypothetical protein [Magnetococcus marinus MC-1]|uniref:Uncharacterized protein n=1 Tax=Magnetococcus marinus (strain ATCC BAA-1437 / JCM 17883 / MC-1) TaxID=156889 RepID=A0L9E0_MAGMM|nr:conserved hypothetical protein [Magnetococcus marinus MC-1]
MGDDFPHLQSMLRPTDRLSETWPCPYAGDSGCPRQVVELSNGHYVAACRHEGGSQCEDIPLETSDLVIHELDRRKLVQLSALALGIEPRFSPIEGLFETYYVGTLAPVAWQRHAIYLILDHRPHKRLEMVTRLGQIEKAPFILLVPTRRFISTAVGGMLQALEATSLTLMDLLVENVEGQLAIGPGVSAFVDQFTPAEHDEDSGPERFPTPSDAQWGSFQLHFLDGSRLTAMCRTHTKEEQRTINFTQMGMANRTSTEPNVQWRLLSDFAESYGRIEVGSRKDDPKNRKRVQRLNEKLCAYFGLDGHPVYWDKEDAAYRCRFQIEYRS